MPSDAGLTLPVERPLERDPVHRPTDPKPANRLPSLGERGKGPDGGEKPIELWPIASVPSIGMLRGLAALLVALGLIVLVVGVVALVVLGHSSDTEHARVLLGALSGGRGGG